MNNKKFIFQDKMSKKARKELNNQKRVIWEHSPVTKIVESKKRYNRKNYHRIDDD